MRITFCSQTVNHKYLRKTSIRSIWLRNISFRNLASAKASFSQCFGCALFPFAERLNASSANIQCSQIVFANFNRSHMFFLCAETESLSLLWTKVFRNYFLRNKLVRRLYSAKYCGSQIPQSEPKKVALLLLRIIIIRNLILRMCFLRKKKISFCEHQSWNLRTSI